MDRIGIYLKNLEIILGNPKNGIKAKGTRIRSHHFIQWESHISCMLTYVERRRPHRCFGHSSTNKLINFLERSEIKDIGPETRRIIAGIERTCDLCKTYAQMLCRFKFTLCDDKDFNHSLYTDIFYIESKPALHVVDEATYFQTAR